MKNIFLCCFYIPPIQEVGTDEEIFLSFFLENFISGSKCFGSISGKTWKFNLFNFDPPKLNSFCFSFI